MDYYRLLKRYIPHLTKHDSDSLFRVDVVSGDVDEITELDDYDAEYLDFLSQNQIRDLEENRLSVFTGTLKVSVKSTIDLDPKLLDIDPVSLIKYLWEETDELLEALYDEYDHFHGEGDLVVEKTRLKSKSLRGKSAVFVISTEIACSKFEQVLSDGPDY